MPEGIRCEGTNLYIYILINKQQLIKATRSLREDYMDFTGSLRKEDHEDPPVKKTQLN